MIVVSDTSPLNYLVLIGQEKLLQTLFGEVVIPQAFSMNCAARALRRLSLNGLKNCRPGFI